MEKGSEVKNGKEEPVRKSFLKETFLTTSFLEKLTLLLITALLTGVLIPYVFKRIDTDRVRKENILQAQTKLLEDISTIGLTYETLALDVSWFNSSYMKNKSLSEKAFKKYSERTSDIILQWRATSIRAYILASPSVSRRLDLFLRKVFEKQDEPMTSLYGKVASTEVWDKQHQINLEMIHEFYNLISELAITMKITNKELKTGE